MTHSVDLYWSFRSPYSYLATRRIVDLTRDYDLHVAFRPVYPMAMRQYDFFDKVDPLMPSYVTLDTKRMADFLGIPFTWPDPDPIILEGTPPHAAAAQPFIHRLTRLGAAAARQGKGLAFADEVSQLIFGGTKGWHLGNHLTKAAARAGLDLVLLDAAIETDADGYEAEIQANQAALNEAGHWGVPNLVFEGEPFFGQDRIEACVWRMKANGLEARA